MAEVTETAKVVITGDTRKAVSELKKLGVEVKKVEKTTDEAAVSLSKIEKGLIAAFGIQTIHKIDELVTRSFQLRNVFGNLKGSIDEARAATQGLVGSFDLARLQTNAMRLGAVETSAEFARLAAAGSKLALSTGGDATKGVEDLTTALARGSAPILDNLGITLSMGEAQRRYATRLGKTVGELNEYEKKQAFITEGLAAAELAAKAVTIETDNMAGGWVRAKVALGEFTDTMLLSDQVWAKNIDAAKQYGAEMLGAEESMDLMDGTATVFGHTMGSLVAPAVEATVFQMEALNALMGPSSLQKQIADSNQKLSKFALDSQNTWSWVNDAIAASEKSIANSAAMTQGPQLTENERLELNAQIKDDKKKKRRGGRKKSGTASDRFIDSLERDDFQEAGAAEALEKELSEEADITEKKFEEINKRAHIRNLQEKARLQESEAAREAHTKAMEEAARREEEAQKKIQKSYENSARIAALTGNSTMQVMDLVVKASGASGDKLLRIQEKVDAAKMFIRAGVETAEAVASFARYDYIGGAAHVAAAVLATATGGLIASGAMRDKASTAGATGATGGVSGGGGGNFQAPDTRPSGFGDSDSAPVSPLDERIVGGRKEQSGGTSSGGDTYNIQGPVLMDDDFFTKLEHMKKKSNRRVGETI